MAIESIDLAVVQSEVGAWALRNFGEQDPYRPLLGVLEELGEYAEARDGLDEVEIKDAVGDVAVYMLHYCHLRDWSFQDLWEDRFGPSHSCMYYVKALCHHHLKGAQGIRGGAQSHDVLMRRVLSNLLWFMDQAALDVRGDFLSVMQETWNQVKLRDWRKNPNNADKVAAAIDAAPAFHNMVESMNISRQVFGVKEVKE